MTPDRISELEAENKRLREALMVFAGPPENGEAETAVPDDSEVTIRCQLGDLRRAHAALKASQELPNHQPDGNSSHGASPEPVSDAGSDDIADTFGGDDAHLCNCIAALLALDANGALVPHGIGGHASNLLSAAYVRMTAALSSPNPPEEGLAGELEHRAQHIKGVHTVHCNKKESGGDCDCYYGKLHEVCLRAAQALRGV